MIKDWLELDGVAYNVVVTSISEGGTVLYSENTGRTVAVGAPVTLDPLGTFYNYKVTVKRRGDNLDEYDKLFMEVTKPRYNGFQVKAVHNQGTWIFEGYISSAERKLKKIDEKTGKVYWDSMSINIIANKAQVVPV